MLFVHVGAGSMPVVGRCDPQRQLPPELSVHSGCVGHLLSIADVTGLLVSRMEGVLGLLFMAGEVVAGEVLFLLCYQHKTIALRLRTYVVCFSVAPVPDHFLAPVVGSVGGSSMFSSHLMQILGDERSV